MTVKVYIPLMKTITEREKKTNIGRKKTHPKNHIIWYDHNIDHTQRQHTNTHIRSNEQTSNSTHTLDKHTLTMVFLSLTHSLTGQSLRTTHRSTRINCLHNHNQLSMHCIFVVFVLFSSFHLCLIPIVLFVFFIFLSFSSIFHYLLPYTHIHSHTILFILLFSCGTFTTIFVFPYIRCMVLQWF